MLGPKVKQRYIGAGHLLALVEAKTQLGADNGDHQAPVNEESSPCEHPTFGKVIPGQKTSHPIAQLVFGHVRQSRVPEPSR